MGEGLFITFEGADGAGKTTQIKHLAAYLEGQGKTVVVTREPGGVPNGEAVRELLLSNPTQPWSSLTEAFLIAAARAEHVRKLIQPSLNEGKVVICDRYSDSTLAYQGYGRGVPLATLHELVNMAEQGARPDLTIILDIDIAAAAGRVGSRGEAKTVFETTDNDFRTRVRNGFLDLAAGDPNRCRVVDADREEATIAEEVEGLVKQFMDSRAGAVSHG
ncbi:MAG: dTMP kinase [Alphaproteobacteria bacterium]|nr:dTMP kinase [Alphaproteobacteria bacterium SS10]